MLEHAHARDLILTLDSGDKLGIDALFEFASEMNSSDTVDFLYADERRVSPAIDRTEAFFKPDWSRSPAFDQLHWPAMVRIIGSAAKANRPRPFDKKPVGNFDLVLSCTETPKKYRTCTMCSPREIRRGELSRDEEMQALKGAIARRQLDWTVGPGLVQKTYRCRPKSHVDGLVSIIIPTCAAQGLIKTCIESLRNVTTTRISRSFASTTFSTKTSEWKPWLRDNCDVVVEILQPSTGRVSTILPRGRRRDPISCSSTTTSRSFNRTGWKPAGSGVARGCRRCRTAAALSGPQGSARGNVPCRQRYCPARLPFLQGRRAGYFGLALTQRDVIAVTGACMLVRSGCVREARWL